MTTSRSAAIRAKLIAGYKAEQEDHVNQITEGLLALEKGTGEPREILDRIFREAHSLKGAARTLGLGAIQELAHGMEDVLGAARGTEHPLVPEHYDVLYRALDACGAVLARVEAGDADMPLEVLELARALGQAREAVSAAGEPPAVPGSSEPPDASGDHAAAVQGGAEVRAAASGDGTRAETFSGPEPAADTAGMPQSAETIRVAVAKLDALMDHMTDLVLAQIRAEQRLLDVRQLQSLVLDWQELWLRTSTTHKDLLQAGDHPMITPWQQFLLRNRDNLNVINAQLAALQRQLNNDRMRLALVSESLDDEVKRVRVLPLSTITAALARMVRDVAREAGKEVTLRLVGTDLEIDKRVLELVKDPLVHLLRNAVDHGVETPQLRAAQGKPSDGMVTLAAEIQGNSIVLRVSDDGAGLDLEAIGAKAVEKGLITPEALAEADEQAVAELIFKPGLSTSRIITDLSGRGVGLDVVRHNVEEVQGTCMVSFAPSRGTTFTVRVPLALTSLRGLLVRAGGQTFAMPLSAVESIIRFDMASISSIEGQDAIMCNGRPVGLVRLNELMNLPPVPRKQDLAGAVKELAVVLSVSEGAGAKRLAVLVDELTGEQEIVMKKLTGLLSRVPGIAGVTVLGTGRAVLILNVGDLVRLAARGVSRTPVSTAIAERGQARRRTVLVVDDSVTTRSLEKNLLSAAGYIVRLATDGEEALASLATEGTPDLVITDVLMPRLDGFSLTQRLRSDERYRDIPVILVTSLDSPADKARGIAVGADAYIVKSDFDQSNLLATIDQLI